MAIASKPNFALDIDFSVKGNNVAPDWIKQFLDCGRMIIGLGGIVRESSVRGAQPKELRTVDEFNAFFKD